MELNNLSYDELNELARQIKARLEDLEIEAEEKLWPKKYDMYLHNDDESMYYDATNLGIKGDDAQLRFANCCYEVCLELEVHKDGSTYALSFEGVPLTEKAKLS